MDREKLTIREVRDETPYDRHYRLDGASPAFLAAYREPGLKVRVHAGGGAFDVGLASRPLRPPVELLVERASPLGQALDALAPGATVEVSLPFGDGVPFAERDGESLLVFGRGAGLGPARAAILHAIASGGVFRDVTAVLEGLYPNEIAYHDELPAWQRGHVTVCQTLSRPDVAKWRSTGPGAGDVEGAYIYDFTLDLLRRPAARFDPERTLAFVAGPDDMVQGVTAALRALEVPPDRVFVFDLPVLRAEHRREPERPAKLLAKLTAEGTWGSGHQDDAPDHPPVLRTPEAQPAGLARPRYKEQGKKPARGGH